MIKEKGLTSNTFHSAGLEIKTTDEIVEQRRILLAMAENNLMGNSKRDFQTDLKNKQWTSNQSLRNYIINSKKKTFTWEELLLLLEKK